MCRRIRKLEKHLPCLTRKAQALSQVKTLAIFCEHWVKTQHKQRLLAWRQVHPKRVCLLISGISNLASWLQYIHQHPEPSQWIQAGWNARYVLQHVICMQGISTYPLRGIHSWFPSVRQRWHGSNWSRRTPLCAYKFGWKAFKWGGRWATEGSCCGRVRIEFSFCTVKISHDQGWQYQLRGFCSPNPITVMQCS